MKKISVFILFLLVLGMSRSFAQQSIGKLAGKVVDAKNGEDLVGAFVVIKGTTTAAVADINGKYILQLSPGTYNLEVKSVSYLTKEILGVVVKPGLITTLDIHMDPEVKQLKSVVVKGELKRESVGAILAQQRNAAAVSDGISAESIKRTPDRNTSDVLKRISGASIQDNRFAIIRGLNERYTTAYINGAPLPSSESDRKAFSFDIFPSNLLDNLVITKTATPNLPGEFGGGIIEINTKSIPESNFQSLSFSSGYNTITTFKDRLTYKGGKFDWLGIDDGTRALPSGIPSDKLFPSLLKDQAELGKQMKNDWALKNSAFSPNYGFQYTMGRVWSFKEESKFGFITGVTYSLTNSYNTTARRQYDSNFDPNIPVQLTEDYLDKNYVTQTLAGLLANFTYKVNKNNELSFKNLYSINSDNRVIMRNGTSTPLDPNPTLNQSSARWFTGNNIYSTQLAGSHFITAPKVTITWNGAYSEITRDIPDLRRNSYSRHKYITDPNNPDIPDYIKAQDTMYKANIAQANVGPDYAGNMFYARTNEKIHSFKGDISRAFDSKSLQLKNTLRVGMLFQERSRDFTARQLGYIKYAPPGNLMFPDSILYLPEGELFSSKYMGQSSPGYGGLALSNKYKPTDSYSANSKLTAAFVMLDNKLMERFRLIWGARIEKFEQNLHSALDNGTPLVVRTTKTDILPSANFVYSLTEKQNIRLAYSHTLNRPEFRELAPFAFYDFASRFVVSGNSSMKRALIKNYDVRYEFFPGRGQLISASLFYKNFINPIEQVLRQDVTNEMTYRNLKKANVYGAEIEFRALIGSVIKAEDKSLWNNVTVFSNVTLTKSKVDLKANGNDTGLVYSSRPLQGQSPYIINSGVQFQNYETGLTISLSYNRVGPRIFIVGNPNEPDIWENGRDMLDFQIGKTFLKNKMDIRLNVKDALAQKLYFFQDRNHNKKFDPVTDGRIWVTNFGQVVSFTATYKL